MILCVPWSSRTVTTRHQKDAPKTTRDSIRQDFIRKEESARLGGARV